jgi:hypothetical protein
MGQFVIIKTFRTFEEIESIRDVWSCWQREPNVDLDLFQATQPWDPPKVRPHVVVLYRDGLPEAMLAGIVSEREFKARLGPWNFALANARLLQVIPGGALGHLNSENCNALIGEILRSMCQGEMDVAVLMRIEAGSSLQIKALGSPGLLSRDYAPGGNILRYMVLPSDIEGCYRILSPNLRHQVRKKTRRLMAAFPEKVKTICFRHVDELDCLVDDIEEVAKSSFQRGLGGGFIDSPLVRRALRIEAQKNVMRGFVLYVDARPCAFWLGSLCHSTFHLSCGAYNPEFHRFSPGMLLLMKVFEHFCGDNDEVKVSEIDLGIGDFRYKEELSNRAVEQVTVHIFAPTLKGLVFNTVRTASATVDRIIRHIASRTQLRDVFRRLRRATALDAPRTQERGSS